MKRLSLAVLALVFAAGFLGGQEAHQVMVRACAPRPEDRYQSLAEFDAAWRAAR